MSVFEDGSYSCTPGISLIGKVLAGRCSMRYTRAAVGKGQIPEGETPKTMTEPADYVMDAKISSVTNPVNGECQITVQINSSDVETGFYATGILLYAQDPDDGEVPYTYLVLENGPEWIRPSSSVVGKLATFDLIAAVGDVDKVTATIDPDSIVTISAAEQLLSEHNSDPQAHPEIQQALEEFSGAATLTIDITIPVSGWVEDSDTNGAYALHADISSEQITQEMIPILTILPEAQATAKACEMSTASRTVDGALRVYAQKIPAQDMQASLSLLGGGSGASGGGTGYRLPVATATRLGGVKIGDGVNVQGDGTISVNVTQAMQEATATGEEVAEMLETVFEEI